MMSDGAQGLRHVVPLAVTASKSGVRPLRLAVRHYLVDDNDARIVNSRLKALFAVKVTT